MTNRLWLARWIFVFTAGVVIGAEPARLTLQKGDSVVIIGNTLAEREQYFGRFETLLHSRFPDLNLRVRDLGWSADELTLRPRSQDFKDHGNNLEDHKADVILAFFGFNESFDGLAGLPKFETDLDNFIKETLAAKYNGKSAPRLALISPIAQEKTDKWGLPDGNANNPNIQLYTDAMAKIAAKNNIPFVNLYAPTLKLYPSAPKKLTINGIHLSDKGYAAVVPILDESLFGPRPTNDLSADAKETLRKEILEKNTQFFHDLRALNGFYIYGGRKKPFGVVNFPDEFVKLRQMTANRDRRIWDVAQGKAVPATIDDSNTIKLKPVETNVKDLNTVVITDKSKNFTVDKQNLRTYYVGGILPPEEALKTFKLPPGYEINLFASEVEFPDLANPVQLTFDAKGRLWVCTMPTYPMYLPGGKIEDKVLIFEDSNKDGKADKQTIFADGLHLPTGLELGDGGCYVAAQPNLVHLKDTDGDDKADVREMVLHGFDSADSHHSISTFVWGPGGDLYFMEGTFHRSQIETPFGPTRLADAGVFRYEPRTGRCDVFVSYRFANPWGENFDRWGQNFIADASGGANYFAAAFSGDIDYPEKHPGLNQILKKEWRPTSGCEFVSSRNFPDDVQGNYLLNNVIGFQGTLQYKMKDSGTGYSGQPDNRSTEKFVASAGGPATAVSGFAADPVEPLLSSSDPTFRPVDLEFGPDGALYIIDWSNPLVGHMQHSVRDPNRDNKHGRIYRIRYKDRPLVEPAKIAGEPIAALLDLLKTYEDRTRYRVRLELRDRDTDDVMKELDRWVGSLDKNDPEYEHHLLEALWVMQHHNVVNEHHLRRVLRSPDFRARAAATRVLCYWRDRVSDPLELLRVQVNDEHPRVRLEAVRACSFFRQREAMSVALESLVHPQDYYLEYTLNETVKTLESRLKASGELAGGKGQGLTGHLIALLKEGNLPKERQAAIVDMITVRGSSADLAYVFTLALSKDAFPADLRQKVLHSLYGAATNRNVRPAGKLDGIASIIDPDNPAKDVAVQAAALKLAGALKVKTAAAKARLIALSDQAPISLRQAALESLAGMDPAVARQTCEDAIAPAHATAIRFLGVASLARLDLPKAAEHAAKVLQASTAKDDPGPMLVAFLDRKQGPELLGAAVAKATPNSDVAKIALRYLYSVGRSDAALVGALSSAAGLGADPPPPTAEDVAKIVAEVASKGDPHRGEQIFRRKDLSCMKCHSVSKGGGIVGPDLSAVGSSSPAEYLVYSILNPDQAIKEAYLTRIVATTEGEVHTGIMIEKDKQKIVLRNANGDDITIPVADIEAQKEGSSLMPKGLTKFLTRDELVDLVRFLSELGKPGDFAIKTSPSIQKWRVLDGVPADIAASVPDSESFRENIYETEPARWSPAYGKVAGALPLDELIAGKDSKIVFLQGDFDVTVPGPVALQLNSAAGAHVWIDDRPLGATDRNVVELSAGRHRVTLRIDVSQRPQNDLKLEVAKPQGAATAIQFGG